MKHKWTLAAQAKFLQMIGELLERGYPLADALISIQHHLPKQQKANISAGIQSLKEGECFSRVLQKLAFHDDLVGYVFFAEQHGNLAAAFLAGSKMMKKRVQHTAKLQKLLAYPLFLIFITLVLFVFMQKLLLPRFSSLFTSLNVEENLFTIFVSVFSKLLPLFFCLLLLFISILTVYYFLRFRSFPPLVQKSKLMKIPLVSAFFQLYFSYYFSIQLSYLLGGGLSVYESLSLFEQNVKQPFYSALGRKMKKQLRMGEQLEEMIRNYPFFEKELPLIIHHGQKNGKLDMELDFYAQYCLQRLEDKMERTMKRVQPVLFAIIGLMIVSMYLSVLLPMFHLLNGM